MIKILKTIRQDSSKSRTDDILKVKQALSETGHYELPEYGLTPYPDKAMYKAIREFQKDKDLKVDGIIKPQGETINALNSENSEITEPSKSPTYWCTVCGAPHGGSKGDMCPSCDAKS